MKISTKLRLAVFVPVLLALIIAVALFLAYQDMDRMQEAGDTVRHIRSSITELNHMVFAYALYHEDRPREQFTAGHEALLELIDEAFVNTEEQSTLLESIRENHEVMGDLFSQLVINYEQGGNAQDVEGTQDRLVGLLMLRSYQADTDAALLRDLVDGEIANTQVRMIGLILLVLVVSAVPLSVVLARTRKDIVASLTNLRKGAAVIGSGNLDYRIDVRSSDETGELSAAFNSMAADLKTVTASKSEMEKEIRERAKAERFLKKSEEKFRIVADFAYNWEYWRGEDNKIIYMSPSCLDFTGYSSEEFIENPELFLDIIHPEDREEIGRHIREDLAKPDEEEMEFRIIRRDGEVRWVAHVCQPVTDDEGGFRGRRSSNRDITERKRAEEALKESEHKYRTLFSSMSEGFALHELVPGEEGKPCDYRFLEVNEAFEELTGFKREDIIDKTVREVMPGIDDYWIQNYSSVVLTGEPIRYENYSSPLGRWYTIYAYATEKNRFAVMFADVTERKKAEEALKASEKEIRELVETANSIIIRWEKDGKIKFINDYGLDFLGYTGAELTGASITKILPTADSAGEEMSALVNDIIRSPENYKTLVNENVRKDGSIAHVLWTNKAVYDDNGELKEILAIGNDITELTELQDALKASEQRWATTLASIGDAVIATDMFGRITFMNGVAEDLTGWRLDEAAGQPVADIFNIVNEQTRQTVESPVDRVLREGAIVGLANHTVLVRKDGTEVPIDDSGAPIKDESGRMRGVVLVFRDITERKKSDRLKDEFIGMVSHEIKTPLTVIIGALSTARMEGLPDDQVKEFILDALNYADILADIVDNLLELSRSQSDRLVLDKAPADIREIAEKVVSALKTRSNGHHLTMEVPEGLPTAMIDRTRAERIVYNLVDNAIKYSPDGGEVRIFAGQRDGSIIVGVRDQGIGISTEDQVRLFRRFERLDFDTGKAIQGIGLGLNVCRILVEAHGGSIWVESEQGEGSTFYFTLPLTGTGQEA